jgi:hypothetical protein
MTSKFTGRDYTTLRSEIIEFLRKKLPNDWDYNNLSDPVVIFAESLARVGEQLHYTIDELRRECDVATAKRASSIYSYAMREGYKMFLPRGSFGTLSINTTKAQDGLLHLHIAKFDEIKVKPLGESLYVANENISGKDYAIDADLHAPVDKNYLASLSRYYDDKSRNAYQAYVEDINSKTQRVKVVLGTKNEFSFTYNDINKDSTVELPDTLIDRDLVKLEFRTGESDTSPWEELEYVDDVISSGFNYKSFTLTPKFIGGAITLCIEFPTNYKDIFERKMSTIFRFTYIKIKNSKIEPLSEYSDNARAVEFPEGAISVVDGHDTDQEIVDNGMQYRVDFGGGIKGYAEYEDANVTRENYKKFLQNYSALLTKDDYTNYVKATSSSHCMVFDHGDMYKSPQVLPDNAGLIPRVVYVVTDYPYSGRENLWLDLKERSSRSDCIQIVPFGKDPYMIVINAECYLMGTSASAIATQIEKEIINYYGDSLGERIPKISMINYLAHKASDKVVRMDSLIVRDTTFGRVDATFNNVNQFDNSSIDKLYSAIENEDTSYVSPLADEDKRILLGIAYLGSDGNVYYSQEEIDEENAGRTDDNQITVTEFHYNKYTRLTYPSRGDSKYVEYMDYPESFPRIYDTLTPTMPEITDYDELIEHQYTYQETDSPDWDIIDKKIFYPSNNIPEVISFTLNGIDKTFYISVDDTDYDESNPTAEIHAKPSDDPDPHATVYYDIYTNSILTEQDDEYKLVEGGVTLLNAKAAVYRSDMLISNSYKKHHYMVPVLNKIVILIKATNMKQ